MRVRAALGAVSVAAFVASVVAQLLPGSPWNALAGTDDVVRSPFAQRWNLFAPNPPAANLSTHVEAGYRDDDDTRHVTPPFDLSRAVREEQVGSRLAPPRLARVVSKFNASLSSDRPPLPPDAYRRLLCSVAAQLVPSGAEIERVRGVVIRTWTQPFTERHEVPQIRRETAYDTGWLLFESGVEPFDVVTR
ncbi:MAG: DUF5819 family protein [Actinomycetota bacterium]